MDALNAGTIVARIADFGMKFDTGAINVDGRGAKGIQLRADAPVLVVVDIDLFTETFPAHILTDSMDGQSIRVQSQRITRDSLEKNRSLTNDALKEMLVDRIVLKNRARTVAAVKTVEVVKFRAMDGADYGTELEMQQANVAALVGRGMDLATAKSMLGL